MKPSQLDRDHHQGQKWDLLGEIEELKRRLDELERAAALGLFAVGGTTMYAPGAIFAGTEIEAPYGIVHYRSYGEGGGFMVWEGVNISSTSQTIIGAGDQDVAYRLWLAYVVGEISGGQSSAGTANIAVGGSATIYNDGSEVVQVEVTADGAAKVRRSAGSDTFRAIFIMIWL